MEAPALFEPIGLLVVWLGLSTPAKPAQTPEADSLDSVVLRDGQAFTMLICMK